MDAGARRTSAVPAIADSCGGRVVSRRARQSRRRDAATAQSSEEARRLSAELRRHRHVAVVSRCARGIAAYRSRRGGVREAAHPLVRLNALLSELRAKYPI